MNSMAFASIKEIRNALNSKKISVKELLEHFLARCVQHDKKIAALIEVFDQDSILKEQQKGSGILDGIPGIIKDNICIEGRIASCGSKILSNYKAPYDATATKRLKDQGALLIARANCDEFAMGSSTETSFYGITKNPWNVGCVPGGSSGGSAAAVAAGLATWSLGTETGGSVRQPAAFCGIVGLKPTYGSISRYGIVSYGSSLDQVGVFARTVHDVATVFGAMAGHDERDASSLHIPTKDYTASLETFPAGLRVGIIENALTAEGMDQEISAAVAAGADALASLGATIKKVNLPILDYGAATYFIVSRAEAASNLARFDGIRYGMRTKSAASLADVYQNTRHDGFGSEVRKRIMIGNYVLSAGHAGQFYENAKRVIRLMRRDVNEAFKDVDVLLLPTHSVPAFPFGAYSLNKLQMDLQDYFTCQANLIGIPALSVPCGFTKSNLPIGMQLMAPHLQEELLFQVAHAYEQKTSWHTMHPDGY